MPFCYIPAMKDKVAFTGRQIAAARTLIGMEQQALAEAAGVSAPTLRRMELSEGIPGGIRNNLLAIQRALEAAGAVFVFDSEAGGAGVRLKRLESAADLTRKIDTIEADLAKSTGPSAKTPAGGMRTLERAYKREAVKKLKNRRTRLKK
jgi:transcriptional regulator with XRE-family HTH domain